MRRPSSAAMPKLPVGHGSICTLSKSVMPRGRMRRHASRGASCRAMMALQRLLEQQRGAHVGSLLPRHDLAGGDGDHRLDDRALGTGHDHQPGPAFGRVVMA